MRILVSRRDVLLLLIGALSLHLLSMLRTVQHATFEYDGQTCPHVLYPDIPPPPPPIVDSEPEKTANITNSTRSSSSLGTTPITSTIFIASEADDLAHTSIVAHAPGWTLFRNLYMENGTLYILSSNRSFPAIRMMTSTGLEAHNTPESIALREPTSQNMDFITPEEASKRWGGDTQLGEPNRVWTIEGNTLLLNDPSQFLGHYYHLVAELFFGVWAFWHGVWTEPSTSPEMAYTSSYGTSGSTIIPPIHRAIFAHSNAKGWRDGPGFNAYFLRAAFPSLTIEVQEDWNDRIAATSLKEQQSGDNNRRAWLFPLVLLTDRSAAFRGVICGNQNQRTAAEAWEFVKRKNQLVGEKVGGWWDPVRKSLWKFAGVPSSEIGTFELGVPDADYAEGGGRRPGGLLRRLSMPEKVVITYLSRQGGSRRKLVERDHEGLVAALQKLVQEKGSEWELNVIRAEKMTKDDQIKVVAKTTILLGVHGNGLTHLVFMKPTRVSAVIEMFYPGGFAHDYQWTTRALGMEYYGVWKDIYFNHTTKPPYPSYPEGFQNDYIPVDGPAVARLIEDHIERGRMDS